MSTTTPAVSKSKIIDSHLHVWANQQEASKDFPYASGQEPPESLQNRASTNSLLEQMDTHGVDGALIVQPINHKFDHSYVLNAIETHPNRFKGMLLHDPSMDKEQAVSTLEDLVLKGFVGVRYNPYLWPVINQEEKRWTPMSSTEAGCAVYQRCGELSCPVGVMCFQGLQHHYNDIVTLLQKYPKTIMILDHFGFTKMTDGDTSFQQLLTLGKEYPNCHVKISALFRQGSSSGDQEEQYKDLRERRFQPLLDTFGSERLLFGTDFPFVLEQSESYGGTVDIVQSWIKDLSPQQQQDIMGGTAGRLFGPWETTIPK